MAQTRKMKGRTILEAQNKYHRTYLMNILFKNIYLEHSNTKPLEETYKHNIDMTPLQGTYMAMGQKENPNGDHRFWETFFLLPNRGFFLGTRLFLTPNPPKQRKKQLFQRQNLVVGSAQSEAMHVGSSSWAFLSGRCLPKPKELLLTSRFSQRIFMFEWARLILLTRNSLQKTTCIPLISERPQRNPPAKTTHSTKPYGLVPQLRMWPKLLAERKASGCLRKAPKHFPTSPRKAKRRRQNNKTTTQQPPRQKKKPSKAQNEEKPSIGKKLEAPKEGKR